MEELIQLVAKTYGVVGIIMLSPIAGCVFLWRAYVGSLKDHRASEQEWMKEIKETHNKRIEDAKEMAAGLKEIAVEQAQLNKETNIALDRINDTMTSLQSLVSTITSQRK